MHTRTMLCHASLCADVRVHCGPSTRPSLLQLQQASKVPHVKTTQGLSPRPMASCLVPSVPRKSGAGSRISLGDVTMHAGSSSGDGGKHDDGDDEREVQQGKEGSEEMKEQRVQHSSAEQQDSSTSSGTSSQQVVESNTYHQETQQEFNVALHNDGAVISRTHEEADHAAENLGTQQHGATAQRKDGGQQEGQVKAVDTPALTEEDGDLVFMRLALEQAHLGAAAGEVPVGAVLVHQGAVVAAAHNQSMVDANPLAHAEMLCIQRANEKIGSWKLEETTLYVTIEPCPMCAGAILQVRLARVVYGARQPRLGADGSWISMFPQPATDSTEEEQGPKRQAEMQRSRRSAKKLLRRIERQNSSQGVSSGTESRGTSTTGITDSDAATTSTLPWKVLNGCWAMIQGLVRGTDDGIAQYSEVNGGDAGTPSFLPSAQRARELPGYRGNINERQSDPSYWDRESTLEVQNGKPSGVGTQGGQHMDTTSTHYPAKPHPFHPNIQIDRGVMEEECGQVMKAFFKERRRQSKEKRLTQ